MSAACSVSSYTGLTRVSRDDVRDWWVCLNCRFAPSFAVSEVAPILQSGHFMQRLHSLFERGTDERSPVTFATDFCKIDERNVRAVTKDYTRATYPAWRQLMWYDSAIPSYFR